VQAQRYRAWQLIIVDDGSTDATPDVLAPLPIADDRIVVLRQRNRGLAHARNAGLRLAEGAYVCFLDSDDEFRPTHIASRVAYMKRHASVDMMYGGLTVRGPVAKRYVADLEVPGRKIHVQDCFVGGTFFMRRSVLRRGFRFRPLPFGEDLDLIRRIQRRCSVKKVEKMRTYVYHCETADRMCDVFTAKALKQRG